ncbi:hypothetical protein [Hymenobacter koreensis]
MKRLITTPHRLLMPALILSLSFAATAQTPTSAGSTRYRATSIGISTGWNAPYAAGLELSHFITRQLDLNVGVGTGLSGKKFGVGARYFVAPERRLSPYFGLNAVYSPGRRDIEVNSLPATSVFASDRIGTLEVLPTAVLHLRSGLRWQPGKKPGRVGLLGSIGYGIRSRNPMRYTMYEGEAEPSPESKQNYRFVFAPGGVELSLGLSIGLGQKMRE